jgi:hypothetical protein
MLASDRLPISSGLSLGIIGGILALTVANSFSSLATLRVGNDSFEIYRLDALSRKPASATSRAFPFR